MQRFITIIVFLFCFSGCSNIPSASDRYQYVRALTMEHGWIGQSIKTDVFLLQAYMPASLATAKTLTIYIEGDGLAWINKSTPSFDPTPLNPLALKLALNDPGPAVYLARPCQYVGANTSHECSQKYWTSYRFSQEVISSTNQAVDYLKLKYKADNLILIGFSGGGAVATLVAANRTDIKNLITVAGNLDIDTWAKVHQIAPLLNSLNPADFSQQLLNTPQLHLVGADDKNVPVSVAKAYQARFPDRYQPEIRVINSFDHQCCWAEQWVNTYQVQSKTSMQR